LDILAKELVKKETMSAKEVIDVLGIDDLRKKRID